MGKRNKRTHSFSNNSSHSLKQTARHLEEKIQSTLSKRKLLHKNTQKIESTLLKYLKQKEKKDLNLIEISTTDFFNMTRIRKYRRRKFK